MKKTNGGEKSRPAITRDDLTNVIKYAQADEIHNGILKLLTDENIDIAIQLLNRIYDSGNIPAGWLRSSFITFTKMCYTKNICQSSTQ